MTLAHVPDHPVTPENRWRAMCDAKRILRMLSVDQSLTAAARAEAAALSELHPTPDLIELIADNPWLCFARWRRCLIRTQAFISVLAAFRQGSDITEMLLDRLAQNYPSPRQITLMCCRQTGYTSRLLKHPCSSSQST
jgi:hypothetical protein